MDGLEFDAGPECRGRSLDALSASVIVGRELELERLLTAAITPPMVALVQGEAGVGKTRLVRELLSLPGLGSRRGLVGCSHRLRYPFPFEPLIDALRGVAADPPRFSLTPIAGALRPLIPELAAGLPQEPERLSDPRAQRHRVFRALRELLAGLGPTVLVLEDLHGVDEDTVDMLSFLLRDPPSTLALILTYRRQDVARLSPLMELLSGISSGAVKFTIDLRPLDVEEVRTLAGVLLQTESISQSFAMEVAERTGGIPFVIEELLPLLGDRGDLVARARSSPRVFDRIEVPGVIRDPLLARIGLLADDARAIARAAAVIGTPVPDRVLVSVTALTRPRGRRGITEALTAGVLKESGERVYGLRHGLATEAVYQDIPRPERQGLHLRVARALESGPKPHPLSRIARHLMEAQAPRWSHYVEHAAKVACSVGEDDVAARLLEDALATPDLPRSARIRMAIALGNAALYSGSPHRAIRTLRSVLEEEPLTTGKRGELRFSLGRLLAHVGDTELSRSETARAADELRRRPQLAARAMVNLALPRSIDGDLDDHLAWLARALRATTRQSDPVTTIAVLAQRATTLLYIGDPRAWNAVAEIPSKASSTEQSVQLLRGYYGLSFAALSLGHYRRAQSFLATADGIQEELSHAWLGMWLATARALSDWLTGAWHGLEAQSRELVESTTGIPVLSLYNQLILASVLLVRGNVAEAERRLTSALDQARAAGLISALVGISGVVARIDLARGDAEAALEVATSALDAVRRKRIWVQGTNVLTVTAEALLARDRLDEARRLVVDSAEGIRGRDAPAAHAALASCKGMVAEAEGSYQPAARSFALAERIWRALSNDYEATQARERQGRCLLAAGSGLGGQLLLDAMDGFVQLGAGWDAARARRQLNEHGAILPYPWRGGPRRYGKELSPRETEVARLAGRGRTNREIAELLFLSPRTVEGHVASARRKLGVASRLALGSAGSGVGAA